MDLLEGIMTTRAMRRYTDEPVSDEEIWTCLRAAVQAPSGGNIQPYQFVVVRDPELKARLGEVYRRAWDRYAHGHHRGHRRPLPQRRGPPGAGSATWPPPTTWPATWATAPALVLVLMPDIEMTVDRRRGRDGRGADLRLGVPGGAELRPGRRAHRAWARC